MGGGSEKGGGSAREEDASGAAGHAERERRNVEKGKRGEKIVSELLAKMCAKSTYTVFDNLLFLYDEKDHDTGRAREAAKQIDHVVLSVHGIFVIETKHWDFDTTFNGKTFVMKNGKPVDSDPIRQNQKHCLKLKDFLNTKAKELVHAVSLGDSDLISVIVFTGNGDVRNIPKECVYVERLEERIKQDKSKKLKPKHFEFFTQVIQFFQDHKDADEAQDKLDQFVEKKQKRESKHSRSEKPGAPASTPADVPPAPASAPALDLSSGKSAHAKNQRKLLVNAAYLVGVTALVAAALFYAPSLLQRGDSDAPRPRETAQPDSAPALDPAAQKLRAKNRRVALATMGRRAACGIGGVENARG